MEIKAKRQQSGNYVVEVGPTIFNLPENVVEALSKVIRERFKVVTEQDKERMQKRLTAYRVLAGKLTQVENALMQDLLNQISSEQMVTLARIAQGDEVYKKIVANLSRQNARQFEEDFKRLERISLHQASTQMEKMVPILKKVIQARKQIQSEG
ncbi:FliG C-terminal domain-containing protein [Thiomicrospira pelophila]|uniref:FliG C-terminal domain-containing protein n=1 Tax=Thiomicrospira pelophila TaxID=934 RepID=UPI0004A72E85|nr:FliG C-terminal domain-containing protein [Thiomicrospira pelophila]